MYLNFLFLFCYVLCGCVEESAEKGYCGTGIEADPHIVRCLAADPHIVRCLAADPHIVRCLAADSHRYK